MKGGLMIDVAGVVHGHVPEDVMDELVIAGFAGVMKDVVFPVVAFDK